VAKIGQHRTIEGHKSLQTMCSVQSHLLKCLSRPQPEAYSNLAFAIEQCVLGKFNSRPQVQTQIAEGFGLMVIVLTLRSEK